MPEERLQRLTDEIYEAAAGEMPWARVCEGMMRLVGATGASMMSGDIARGAAEILYHGEIPLDAVEAYRSHYRTVDLWTTRAAGMAAGGGAAGLPRVWTSGTLVPDREYLGSEFYADFGRRLGLRYVVGAVVPLGEAGALPIGLHRPEGAAPFEATDARLIERLLPHLRRAMQLRHRMRAAGAANGVGLAALDSVASGLLVVDAGLGVIFANAAAEAMAGPGGPIRLIAASVRPGSGPLALKTVYRSETAALAALVEATAMAGSPGGAVALHDPQGTLVIAALVVPLMRRLLPGIDGEGGRTRGQAAILLRDLTVRAPTPRPETLRAVFGLTAAEAEVACALAGGATKEAVARRRKSQVSTVNTHVRAILAKAGATNLRQLEGILTRLGAL